MESSVLAGIGRVRQSEESRRKQCFRKRKFVLRKVKKTDMVGTTAGTLWRQWGLRGEFHLKSRAWNEDLERREIMKSTI